MYRLTILDGKAPVMCKTITEVKSRIREYYFPNTDPDDDLYLMVSGGKIVDDVGALLGTLEKIVEEGDAMIIKTEKIEKHEYINTSIDELLSQYHVTPHRITGITVPDNFNFEFLRKVLNWIVKMAYNDANPHLWRMEDHLNNLRIVLDEYDKSINKKGD